MLLFVQGFWDSWLLMGCLKSHIYKGEKNKWETLFLGVARQRLCKNGQREDKISGDKEAKGKMPKTTSPTLTFYLEFAPIKILKNGNL